MVSTKIQLSVAAGILALAAVDAKTVNALCPQYSALFGSLGAASAAIFCIMGSAYSIAKSGIGIAAVGVIKPDFIMKALIPVVFGAAISIYGLIVSLLIAGGVKEPVYPLLNSFADLGAGLACGLSGLAAGIAIGIAGDAGVRSACEQPRMYLGLILMLIFAEALALFGMIVGIVMRVSAGDESACMMSADSRW